MVAGGRPLFIAFYSFRGGVGRTMALASVGMQLGGLGRRVLLIDFDLEAPGLTVLARGLRARPRAGTDDEPPGVTDIIQDCLKAPHRSPLRVGARPQSLARKYAFRLRIPSELVRMKGGRVDVIPCGRMSEGYRERFHDLDLPALYADGVGAPMMARLKEQIRDCGLYDYVLIDSRTGWSDEGGIVTTHLADHVILFSGLNHQNVEGTADFLRDVGASKRGKNWASLVFSPVPQAYEELRDERAQAARKLIRERASVDVQPVCFIPYHPRIALDEMAFLSTWMSTELRPAYERIAHRVRELASDAPADVLLAVTRAASEQRIGEVKPQVPRLRAEGPIDAASPLRAVEVVYHQFGRSAYDDGDLETAGRWYRECLGLAEAAGDSLGAATMYHELGVLAQDRGEFDAAEEWYRKSLPITEETGDRAAAATTYHQLGTLAQDRGEFDAAEEWYRKSLASKAEIGAQGGAAKTYHQLGTLARVRGDLDAAEEWYRKSVAISGALGDRRTSAVTYYGLGTLAQDRGEFDAAEEWYRKSLAISEEHGDRRTLAATHYALGTLSQARGAFDAAEEWYRRSSAAAEAANDERGAEANRKALEALGEARKRAAKAQ